MVVVWWWWCDGGGGGAKMLRIAVCNNYVGENVAKN